MGRESRRTHKTINETITERPDMPAHIRFFLRHPKLAVPCIIIGASVRIPYDGIVGAWRGARSSYFDSRLAVDIFRQLGRGNDV